MGSSRNIDASNFLAEEIILRHAAAKNKDIPNRIWQDRFKNTKWKYWHGIYWGEKKRASALLKQYDLRDIMSGLKSQEGKVVLSLANEKVPRLTKEAHRKRKIAEAEAEKNVVETISSNTQKRTKFGTKSKLGKLK
jgi:hypothetical protein